MSESVGSVPLCVRLVSGRIQSPRQVSVFVSTADGTAKGLNRIINQVYTIGGSISE